MQGASPLASPGLNPRGTYRTCQAGARSGALPLAGWGWVAFRYPAGGLAPARHWLFLPLCCQAGGVLSLSPACPAFSLLSCPHPPAPLPSGKGETLRLFYARGCAPCIPGAEPGRHLQNLPLCFPVRGLPGWLPARRALTVPTGGVSVEMRLLLTVPAAKERGDRGRGTSAFEMVLSPGAGRTSAVWGQG